MSASTALSALMTEPWHLIATWGVLSGLGSGCVAACAIAARPGRKISVPVAVLAVRSPMNRPRRTANQRFTTWPAPSRP
jgi:hypothetical protein